MDREGGRFGARTQVNTGRIANEPIGRSGTGPRPWVAACAVLVGLTVTGCATSGRAQLGPDDWQQAELAVAAGDWDRAADLWNRLRLDNYAQALRPHLETAAALARLEQQDEALALLRQAAELFPTAAEVPLTQGLLLERMGFRRAAELDLVAAVELAPGNALAHLALGRVRLALDQPRAAELHLERAHLLGADGAEVHRLRARCERAVGELERAHGYYALALEIERDLRGEPSPELLIEAASLHTDRTGEVEQCPRLDEALAWVELASRIDPQSARANFVRAGLLERRGRTDEAIEAYRRTVEIDNLHLGAITNLALLHSHRGEQDRARAMVERAVALEDDVRRRRALLALVQ